MNNPLPFAPLSVSHLVTLLSLSLFGWLIIASHRKSPTTLLSRSLLGLLVFACLSAYPSQVLAWQSGSQSPQLDNLLPCHFCDVLAFIAAGALLTRRPLLCELTYVWGLAATTQGLFTPALIHDFPNPIFLSFFQLHGAVVLSALLLPLGLGWRPRLPLSRTILRCFGLTVLYVFCALGLNTLLGTNFGFTTAKPETASLLDHFGPRPWYLVVLLGISLLAYTLVLLPFFFSNRTRGKVRASDHSSV